MSALSAVLSMPVHPVAATLLHEGGEHLAVELLQRSRADRARAAGRPREASAREERAAGLRLDASWLFLLATAHGPELAGVTC